jgi:hypothetical protein
MSPPRGAPGAQQPALSPARLVFIDETWATTAMAHRYGRARRGARVVGAVPHGHWKTTTVIAALRHDGVSAPCVFDDAINGARFLAYVEQALAPTLRPGDAVVLDIFAPTRSRACAQGSPPPSSSTCRPTARI